MTECVVWDMVVFATSVDSTNSALILLLNLLLPVLRVARCADVPWDVCFFRDVCFFLRLTFFFVAVAESDSFLGIIIVVMVVSL